MLFRSASAAKYKEQNNPYDAVVTAASAFVAAAAAAKYQYKDDPDKAVVAASAIITKHSF